MPDTLVRPIEKATPTIEVNRRPARQTNQPVRRRIVGPLSLHRTMRISPAKPNLVTKPDIDAELAVTRRAFRIYRSTNSRGAVYIYLSRVFAVVTRWQRFDCALKNALAALRLRPNQPQMKPEPFGIVIFCTADPKIVDDKTRSKWSRVLRYAARIKPEGQRLIDFIKSNGGINECARKFAQPGRRPPAVLGAEHVLGGLCGTFSWVVASGKIRSISASTFIKFGALDNQRSERVERLRQAFEKTTVKADIPSDIHKALWEKFLLVTAFGGVGAVSRAPIGIVRTMPETRALLQQCMEEVAVVAHAGGIQLDDTVVTDTMSYVDTLPANSTTSLQRDIADGKPSELDFWNGSVVRQGRAVNVSTPVNQFIYHSLLPQELRARGNLVCPQ